jgi:hypothetical protein
MEGVLNRASSFLYFYQTLGFILVSYKFLIRRLYMRTLKFIVEDQIIKQDPSCNFDDLVPGTEGYLQAEFSFSAEWDEYVKVAAFYSMMGTEYEPQILKDGRTCIIPAEALKRKTFKVKVFGKAVGSKTMTTNRLEVIQNGGKT